MKPPFTITNTMLHKVVDISKIIGQLEYHVEKHLTLRKENRIKAIQSSLAIEKNTLTIEQMTDIIDGKRVLGHPREIKEVKNAYDAYEEILTLYPYKQSDFLKAHGLLTAGIVNEAGKYRHQDVGIYDEYGNIVHMGARPQFIQSLMNDLFDWGINDDTPEIIKSCVFHYEIETIHPFSDGNGRMGRLWQTVILANWNPIFAWIPIETIIYENQQAYYEALSRSDKEAQSNVFIEFMLDIILKTLIAYKKSDTINHKEIDVPVELTGVERAFYSILKKYLSTHSHINSVTASKLTGKSVPTVRRYLTKFVELDLLKANGHNKNRTYTLV
ncbi:Fic family protein [Granulicatella sp. zg-ZJ]|uniref:Fic family protein n=1 Tax=Granulicatella sp. zg-ZJ TaxID=2678504 RepID=UPI0013D6A6D1|nr:Fic family protein [Granulicatella sp. zg-ZJ]MBS4749830.1 Fic family protein [Carnobacteriaceae bacterium zg-ZUI78]NEW63016.1 Fic family protein [Granulicatella sp. zg-ZJ]